MIRRLMILTSAALIAMCASACGKQAPLERPAPMWGAKARAEYEAQKRQQADNKTRESQGNQREGAALQQPPDNDFNGLLHGEELQVWLFINHNEVHIVTAAQAMIRHREQCVRIRWKINADDIRFLIHNMVYKARILMTKTIMILSPYVRG